MEKLSYTKKILTNVAFDRDLFIKEFNKASKTLSPEKRDALRNWCTEEYGEDILNQRVARELIDG
jgi:hypothetical protein